MMGDALSLGRRCPEPTLNVGMFSSEPLAFQGVNTRRMAHSVALPQPSGVRSFGGSFSLQRWLSM